MRLLAYLFAVTLRLLTVPTKAFAEPICTASCSLSANSVISTLYVGPPPRAVPPILGILGYRIPYQDTFDWNYSTSIAVAGETTVSIPYFDGWSSGAVTTPIGWIYSVEPSASGQADKVAVWRKFARCFSDIIVGSRIEDLKNLLLS